MPKPNGVRYRLDHRFASGRLSTYIDGRLEARERERVERHLAVCPPCREEVLSLRQTVSVLRDLAPRPLPRSLALPASARAAQVQHRRWDVAFGALRTATLVTATLLMLLVSGDALLSAALTGQPVPLVAGEAAPAAAPKSAPESPMALAAPAGEEIPAGEEEPTAGEEGSAAGAEMFSLQAAPAPAGEALPTGDDPAAVAAAAAAEPTAPDASAPPLPEGTPAPPASEASDAYTGAAETAMAPPAGVGEGFVPPQAPPGMGGQGGGGYGVGGAGPEAVVPPTSGPEMGVAAAGATGESSGGGAPAEPEPTAPAATEPVQPEAAPAANEPTGAPEVGNPAAAADATDGAPSPEEGPVAGIAAAPAAPEASAPPPAAPQPPSVARGMGGVSASPEPTAPADRVAARVPNEGAQEEPGVADTARVYGLEAHQALGAWQIIRIGAAMAFGLLLVLLSGLVWSGYQRRL